MIRNRPMFSFAAAAAVAASGVLLAGASGQAQDRPQQQPGAQPDRSQVDRSSMPQGIKWRQEADLDDIRGVIDGIAGAAIAQNGFDDVVERLVDQDRNRIGKWLDEGENRKFEQLNVSAKRFSDAYKTKFNKDLNFDGDKALAGVKAVQGEVEDAKLVAAHWPVPATAAAGQAARAAGGAAGGQDVTDSEGNIEKGREVAVAIIPAPQMGSGPSRGTGTTPQPGAAAERPDAAAEQDRDAQVAGAKVQGSGQGMSGQGTGALRASLIKEMPTWKLDVPNQRTPEQIYTDLAKRLDRLAQYSAAWPSDEIQVQHVLAFEVLSAIYGVESRPAGQPSDRPGAAGDDMGGPPKE